MAGSTVSEDMPVGVVVVVGRCGALVATGLVVETRAEALLTAPQPVKPSRSAARAARADFRLQTAPTTTVFSSPRAPIVRGAEPGGRSQQRERRAAEPVAL